MQICHNRLAKTIKWFAFAATQPMQCSMGSLLWWCLICGGEAPEALLSLGTLLELWLRLRVASEQVQQSPTLCPVT